MSTHLCYSTRKSRSSVTKAGFSFHLWKQCFINSRSSWQGSFCTESSVWNNIKGNSDNLSFHGICTRKMTQGLIIHTGNILQLPDLKRKPGHTPADEVFFSFHFVLWHLTTTCFFASCTILWKFSYRKNGLMEIMRYCFFYFSFINNALRY